MRVPGSLAWSKSAWVVDMCPKCCASYLQKCACARALGRQSSPVRVKANPVGAEGGARRHSTPPEWATHAGTQKAALATRAHCRPQQVAATFITVIAKASACPPVPAAVPLAPTAPPQYPPHHLQAPQLPRPSRSTCHTPLEGLNYTSSHVTHRPHAAPTNLSCAECRAT